MRLKLPIEPLPPTGEDFFYNQRGAKCYFDIRRQPMIAVSDTKVCFEILSAGFSREKIPLVTALVDTTPIYFRLPHEFLNGLQVVSGSQIAGLTYFRRR
jgi:hypothetical protein